MSRGLNQYAVYRLRLAVKETRRFRHHPYKYLQKYGLKINSDYYDTLCLADFDPALDPIDLRRQLEKELPTGVTGKPLEVSDVLAVTKDGITSAYYVDPDKLVALTGFFHVASSSTAITLDTTDYQIHGRPGNWAVAEEAWIDGQRFVLLQSQQFGRNAGYAVLDSHGNVAAEDTTEGFSEETIRQIREFIQSRNNPRAEENLPEDKPANDDQPMTEDQPVHESKPLQKTLPALVIQPLDKNQPAYEIQPFRKKSADTPATTPIQPESTHSASPFHPLPATSVEKDVSASAAKAPDTPKLRKEVKKRRKGVIPLKQRKSVLERLERYKRKLDAKYGHSSSGPDVPSEPERKR